MEVQKPGSCNRYNFLYLISKHRTLIMGVAALWVVLYHSGIHNRIGFQPLSVLFNIGFSGVDIFIFLSGFGLFFSSLKKEPLKKYYYNRFIRVYPVYFLTVIVYYFILKGGRFSTEELLLSLTTLDFWMGHFKFFWYVPAVILLYIIFPFYIKLFQKSPKYITLAGCTLICAVLLFIDYNKTYFSQDLLTFNSFLPNRLPLFFLGIYFGYLLHSGYRISDLQAAAWIGVSLLGLFIIEYSMIYGVHIPIPGFIPYLLMAPGLTMLLGTLFEWNSNKIKPINTFFLICGKMSLELYLVHCSLFYLRGKILDTMSIDSRALTIGLIILSLIVSYVVYWLNQRLVNYLKQLYK